MKENSKCFLFTDTFIKIVNDFDPRVKEHNKRRVEWIAEGKTFAELYQSDSFYRKNILRGSYAGNGKMIDQDINYDLKKKWIKKI
tara:strand:+ start:1105 stop:1359 length:255 start_codon:yes stop_codon:yes gene_type:complete